MARRFRITKGRTLVLGVLLALLGAALFGSQLSSSSASAKKKATVTTINIRGAKSSNGLKLYFDTPKTVRTGDILRIRSLTDGKNVGPHTFSLAAPSAIPQTKADRQKCFTPGHICLTIAKSQGFKPPNKITINPAKAGKAGWDTEATATKGGDSWFSGIKPGNSFQQVVSAKAGTTIHFMCAVHPFMNGEIKVLP